MASKQGEFVANYPYFLSRYILEINQSVIFCHDSLSSYDHVTTIIPSRHVLVR